MEIKHLCTPTLPLQQMKSIFAVVGSGHLEFSKVTFINDSKTLLETCFYLLFIHRITVLINGALLVYRDNLHCLLAAILDFLLIIATKKILAYIKYFVWCQINQFMTKFD